MPKNKTEWMIAHSVTVRGHARPQQYTAEDGVQNSVAAMVIQRLSGVGTLVIEGRPEDLLRVAGEFKAEAERIAAEIEASPGLRSLYGRV
jgi:hypothetical protein